MSSIDDILLAINEKKVIQFYHNKKLKTVQPFILGYKKKTGKLTLAAYVITEKSARHENVNIWKIRFIEAGTITQVTFSNEARSSFKSQRDDGTLRDRFNAVTASNLR